MEAEEARVRRNVLFGCGAALLLCALAALLFYGILHKSGGEVVIPPPGEGGELPSGGAAGELPTGGGEPPGDDAPAASSGAAGGSPGGDLPSEPAPAPDGTSYEEQNFLVDLHEYEQYMNPEDEANEYLLLVNASHPLSEDVMPGDLTPVSATRQDGRAAQRMRRTAAMALEALFLEAKEEGVLYNNGGIVLSVTSAYRSYGDQRSVFEGYVNDEMSSAPGISRAEAEEKVVRYSCRPGTSEHQSGLCCDMHNFASASVSNGMREAFAESAAGRWLTENAARFGFVLRFPPDKTDVTGVDYESWHFRFVGRRHALAMREQNLCLEEYVAALGLS